MSSPPEHTESEIGAESGDHSETFEQVSLDSRGRRQWGSWIRPFVATCLFGSLVVATGYAAYFDLDTLSVAGLEAGTLDWLYGLTLLFLGVVFLPPLLGTPERAGKVGRRLLKRPLAALGAVYLLGLTLVASLYPYVASETTVRPVLSMQPPVWSETSTTFLPRCEGAVVDGQCQGTLRFPLGTNPAGEDLLKTSLLGLNTSLQVALTATVLAATIGVVVGTTAGYVGGRVDEGLMRYVDLQRALPAFFVYILLILVFSRSYPLLILVFGLLSWGGIARTVRGEVMQRRAEPYVQAAIVSGAGTRRIVVRHILPNVSNTVVTACAVLFAKFVVYEASLGYLSLTDLDVVSLGNEIAFATGRESGDPISGDFGTGWDWIRHSHIVAVPAGILCSLLLAVSLLGDAFRDVLDPR